MRHLLAAIAITVAVAWYPVSCAVFPLRDCWCCKGYGHHRPKDDKGRRGRGRISRPCRWCRSTGKRWRIGRRLWNRARRHAREAG